MRLQYHLISSGFCSMSVVKSFSPSNVLADTSVSIDFDTRSPKNDALSLGKYQ